MLSATASRQPLGVVWHMALPAQPAAPMGTLPVQFGRVEPAQAATLAEAMDREDPLLVQGRLETGRRCYAAWVQGQLAAYGWVSFTEEDVGELGLRVRLLPGEAYIWDCATRPDYRRRGLYTDLLGYMVQALRAEEVNTFWIGADAQNAASLSGIARAGFTALADLVAAPPQPGERRRRAWLEPRPGIGPAILASARRAYLGGREEVWVFGQT